MLQIPVILQIPLEWIINVELIYWDNIWWRVRSAQPREERENRDIAERECEIQQIPSRFVLISRVNSVWASGDNTKPPPRTLSYLTIHYLVLLHKAMSI